MPSSWLIFGLAPLAIWILLSGLDDVFVTLVWVMCRRRRFPWPAEAALDAAGERPIAILLPLWREYRVAGRMLERNLAALRYGSYAIFAGVYPNDEATFRAVDEVARRDGRVHVAMLPHDGPTSKGDCLNWAWRRMLDYEALHGVRFEVVMTHDAEDLADADSLRLVNWFSRDYAMVQIPVLALPTGWREWTHGIYCDEFAEYQQKDIPVRQTLGGFLPSNGVGTGFRRDALERLAALRNGRPFDEQCLTEDYENGFLLHELGYAQVFVPLRFGGGRGIPPVATREYFPRRLGAAVRQRSRWVAGIVLQGWQNHGWRSPWRQIYWLWRDRKGLVGNLVSPVANVASCCWLASAHSMPDLPAWLARVTTLVMAIAAVQISARAVCCARIYGWWFASLVPLRILWANAVNAIATVSAIVQFVAAAVRHARPAWLKTEHVYPADVCVTVGPQHSGELRAEELSVAATRQLPLSAIRRWKVMPYRIDLGQLHLLTPAPPTEDAMRELGRYSALEFNFRLVTPREFARLADEVYGERLGSATTHRA